MLGGVPTAVETLRQGLTALGHTVTIVAPRTAGAPADAPGVVRVPALPAPTYPEFALPLPLGPAGWRRLRGLDVDVVHAHHPFLLGGSARRLARATGRPLVFTYHTLYDKYAHYVPLPRPAVERTAIAWSTRFANSADLVLAPSDFVAARLRASGVRRPVEVVPTGIDLARFQPGDRAAARQALGLPEAGPVLLYVGRLDREKNLEFLLAAVSRLAGPAPPRLLLVGRGTRSAALRALGARQLDGRVEFRGGVPRDELGPFYQAADAFVFASTTETQGLAVLEAMACGLPVVAVRSAGVEEVLADGVSGLLVPEEPGAFAAAVAEVLADRDLAEKLAAGGREAAAAFAMPLVLARVVAAYRRAIAEAGRR